MDRGRMAAGAVLLTALVCPTSGIAEIALLLNGQTLKVDRWRLDGSMTSFHLRGGGEVAMDVSEVAAVLPDEVEDEPSVASVPVAAVPAASHHADPIRGLALDASQRHAVDPRLVLAVIDVESAFRPEAVSPKGAMGLMQLMPATAADLGVQDPFDPSANIEGGVRHLRALLDQYRGDQRLALAAYNAGAAAVDRHKGIPPYEETRAYVRRVIERQERYP